MKKGVSCFMYPEFPFLGKADPLLFVEIFRTNHSVEDHFHHFQEFLLITQGSCSHRYKHTITTLVPGDVLLISPKEEHGFIIDADVCMYNCQFYADKMGEHWKYLMEIISFDTMEVFKAASHSRNLMIEKNNARGISNKKYNANINHQGIIHLDSKNMALVLNILKMIIQEQEEQNIGFSYVNQAYLTNILIMLKRVQIKQYAMLDTYNTKRKIMVEEILTYLEDNMNEAVDFNNIAKSMFISPNYFRIIFKDVTGLSPVDYLNRVRVVRSLEYLKNQNISIAGAAEMVGINDSNYFSRIFKKTMGYSPSHFRKENL